MKRSQTGTGILIVLIIVITLTSAGCIIQAPANETVSTEPSALPADRYVALFEEYDSVATVLEGNGTIMYIPVPCPVPHPFDYNGTRGFPEQYPKVNDDLKAMYGAYRVLSSPAGGYTTATYRGIYLLPYPLDSGLIIIGIDVNGTVNASYGNLTFTLKSGDTWRSPVTTEARNESHYIADNSSSFGTMVMRPFLMQYNYSWAVTNKGMFPKANITR